MKKSFSLKFFIILLIFCLALINCGNGLINNDNNIKNDYENENNNLINQIQFLKGTIWYADKGSLFIEFPDNHLNLILFKNNQYFGSNGGNLNGIVTLGNFRLSSFEDGVMKLLDYDNKEVPFLVIISDNKMTVDGLNAIKVRPLPFERKDFRSFNQTYTKGE